MSDLAWGLGMTVAGMGTVFALLLLLMALLMIIGRLDRAPAPAPIPAAPEPQAVEAAPDPQPDEDPEAGPPAVRVLADGLTEDELAAISVAVLTHRDIRRNQAAPETRANQPGSHLYASRWVAAGRAQQTQSRITRRH